MLGSADRLSVPYLPRLQRLRHEATMSQEELARRAGIARPTLSKLEAQQSRARISTVRKLADALGVEPKDLLGPESNESSPPL